MPYVLGVILLMGLFAAGQPTATAQASQGYTIGDVVADFQVKNVDGRTIALADYDHQKGLIVVFTSNHCPFANAYENRLLALDQQYAPLGFPVLTIMANDTLAYEADSFRNMQLRAREKAYTFPYALDGTQAVAQAFGATRTPQAYVLKRTGNQFVLEYVGTIDDNPQDATGVQRRYVAEAVDDLLAGRPVPSPITKPIGCVIKRRRSQQDN